MAAIVLFQIAKLPSESEVESLLLPPKPPSDASKPGKKTGRARIQQSSSSETVRGSSVDGKTKFLENLRAKGPCKRVQRSIMIR